MDNKYKELEDTILRAEKDIAEAKAQLEQLKVQAKENETWKPYKKGFYIQSNGHIGVADDDNVNPHNCFRTEELTELRHKQREAEDELFNIWESLVGNWRPDWTDNSYKYYLAWDTHSILDNHNMSRICKPSYYYFPTRDLARKQYEIASDHAKAYMRGEF